MNQSRCSIPLVPSKTTFICMGRLLPGRLQLQLKAEGPPADMDGEAV